MARFTIKSFGNDVVCDDIEPLQSVLIEQYMGGDVSIVYLRPSGIRHVVFVSISEQGIVDSYKGTPIDFGEIESQSA